MGHIEEQESVIVERLWSKVDGEVMMTHVVGPRSFHSFDAAILARARLQTQDISFQLKFLFIMWYLLVLSPCVF